MQKENFSILENEETKRKLHKQFLREVEKCYANLYNNVIQSLGK